MEVKNNQDLSETSQVALVNEWLHKDSDFNFEVVNEGEHNLEEFTEENTKQIDALTYKQQSGQNKHTQWKR